MDWQPISTAPEGELVMTKIDDAKGARNEQPLAKFGRLWFVDERKSMYVYYEPNFWKPLTAPSSKEQPQ
jgi:hypothetical protein